MSNYTKRVKVLCLSLDSSTIICQLLAFKKDIPGMELSSINPVIPPMNILVFRRTATTLSTVTLPEYKVF